MPDISEAAVEAARMAIFVSKNVGTGQYLPEFYSEEALARAALKAAAPLIIAAIQVTDEMVDRACHALWWNVDIPLSRQVMRRTLEAALSPAQAQENEGS